jgi:SpoVK/Ycf46/Vps4 family AAA+-type ATPase
MRDGRQCTLDLGHLASLVDARPGWEDLVLPDGVLDQLRDFAGAAAERDRVYDGWGMGEVGRAAGRGVAALFSGASGTGKTMSAAVIARATGLDLWRIDLSSVVSKYIGETEKNLERIFAGARDGDAILLFDEADALFGKRSEVRDAHDRYANVEVAYLLQRLEEHDGIAILASNFSRNIDQAFIRRLHYIVEFPLPDARLRERLWRKAFSRRTPIQDRIDYGLLGRQFTLAGGDIRSAALDAAFLAASDGGVITMPHILRAVTRQMLKQGKLPGRHDGAGWRPVNGHADAGAELAP